jgi:hypothetical protein
VSRPVQPTSGSSVDGEHALGVLDALFSGVLILFVVGGKDEEGAVKADVFRLFSKNQS